MALTPTKKINLGFTAPSFSLQNVVSGSLTNYENIKGDNGTVVMFICNHCPFVIHIREQLVALANDYLSKGIGFVAISSNDIINYPQDRPELMKEMAEEFNFPFPYLYDESQNVAKAYDAACTPDFSVFDCNSKCVYRGRLDSSTPGNGIPVTGESLRGVLDKLIDGLVISENDQQPSLGCGIKWK